VAAALTRWVPRTFLEMGKVGTGLFARNALHGIFKLVLAAFLAPGLMGVLRAVQSLFRITTSLCEFGLNYALVTFVPAAIRKGDTADRDRILMTTLSLMVLIITVLFVLGNLFARQIATWTLGDAGLTPYARLAIAGAGGRLIWQFVSSQMTAYQNFGKLALFLTTAPLLMLASTAVLGLLGRLTLFSAVLLVLFAPAATVLVWWPALDRGFLRLGAWNRATAARIARFSRWIYLGNVSSSLRSHLNPLLLKSPTLSGSVASGEVNAGLYGFGNDCANELQMLSGAVVTVLIPKAARATGPAELRQFARRCYRHMPWLLLPLIPVMFLAKPGLLLLSRLSPTYLEYIPALPVFYILYIGGLFSVAAIPMMTVLYALNLPQIEARLEALMVPILVVGGILLIPKYGGEGAALTILAQRMIACAVIVGYAAFRLRGAAPAGPTADEPGLPLADDES